MNERVLVTGGAGYITNAIASFQTPSSRRKAGVLTTAGTPEFENSSTVIKCRIMRFIRMCESSAARVLASELSRK